MEQLDKRAEAELAAKSVPTRKVWLGEAAVTNTCGFEAGDGAKGGV
jgi:hypothetical protein